MVLSEPSNDPSAISIHWESQPGQRYTEAPSTSSPVFTVAHASWQGLETRWRIMGSMVPEPGTSHTLDGLDGALPARRRQRRAAVAVWSAIMSGRPVAEQS